MGARNRCKYYKDTLIHVDYNLIQKKFGVADITVANERVDCLTISVIITRIYRHVINEQINKQFWLFAKASPSHKNTNSTGNRGQQD